MATKLAIIGLGEVGSAFGKALYPQRAHFERSGYDRSQTAAQRALGLGAVDRIHHKVTDAIKGARIILLCLPLHEIQPLIEKIGPDLPSGVLVIDTAPAKAIVTEWMKSALPEGCAYIGLLPTLNLLIPPGETAEEVNPLRQMPVYLAAPPGTSSTAFEAAAELVSMAEAQPVFTDIAELDGLTAKTFLLPALTAKVLFDVTAARPGWQEARRTTSALFAGLAMANENIPPESLHLGVFSNKENILRLLDEYRSAMQELRDQIAQAEASHEATDLLASLEKAAEQARLWRQGRLANQWDAQAVQLPEKQDLLSRWFGIGKRQKK
jgi:cyclohexadieny/prephenate dehydrogenase